MKTKFLLVCTVLLALGIFGDFGVRRASATPVTGAGFTTVNEGVDGTGHCKNGNPAVNCNIYDGKQFVWMNGGPLAAQVGDGTYFFAVLVPGGQPDPNDGGAKNLSDDFDAYTARTFSISSGVIAYAGPHSFDSNKIRLMPYANTTNPGGVYIMSICSLADGYPVDPSKCKYDAFKIREGEGEHPRDLCLSGTKFYDSNNNGNDDGRVSEPGLQGWKIYIKDPNGNIRSVTTDANGNWGEVCYDNPVAGDYWVAEGVAPVGSGWTQTTPDASADYNGATTANVAVAVQTASKSYKVTYTDDGQSGFATGLDFGNVCIVTPGGRTIGFWSNKNGQALIKPEDLTALNNFTLVNGAGVDQTFANKGAYANWLLAATATNMAYMLSAQMSGTHLNVKYGFTNGSAVVTNSCGGPSSCTVSQLLTYAQSLIQANPSCLSVSCAARAEQERVKNLCDAINNGQSITLPPHTCPVPTTFGSPWP